MMRNSCTFHAIRTDFLYLSVQLFSTLGIGGGAGGCGPPVGRNTIHLDNFFVKGIVFPEITAAQHS